MSHDDETLVRDLLTRAADDLPAGGPRAQALLVAGDRAVRHRRRVAVAAAAAVTAVALLGVTALLGVRPAPTPADREGPPTVAPTEFDPAQQLFRLTWLPDGLPERSLNARSDHQTIGAALFRPIGNTKGRTLVRSVTVAVTARGVNFFAQQLTRDNQMSGKLRTGPTPWATPPGSSVAPVQGHPAFLHTSPNGREIVLSWQYAPDAWVTVTGVNVDRAAEVLRRVADGLVWDRQPLRVPVEPVALPAGARLSQAQVSWRDNRWQWVRLGFQAPGSSGVDPDFQLGLERFDESNDTNGTNGTVAGRPAATYDGYRGYGQWSVGELPGCPGCRADVSTQNIPGRTFLGGPDAALGLAARVRAVADPDDEAAWRPL
ncbi:hypothetical protein [Micromonospora sp. NPDC092111]|uniref:hypothetical protein n=1 Tax=Micromonospora sp. NPDC092111 TaxID=3364289 RepID=UPI00381579E9